MNPQRFAQCNIVMTAPARMLNCVEVHACKTAYDDGQEVTITAWTPTRAELVKLNLGEPVYLILCGPTMQPARVTVDSPFDKPEAER